MDAMVAWRRIRGELGDLLLGFCMVLVMLMSVAVIPERWGVNATAAPMVLFAYLIVKFIRWRERPVKEKVSNVSR